MLPIECVVRGYLAGSGWNDYRRSGAVCGIALPEGLRESERLPQPLFTPATKAQIGDHDENIDFETAVATLGDRALAERVRDASIAVYERASEHARERGIIVADTKFEFGLAPDGTLVLGDEVLTPDSSRFWDAATYEPGRPQPSFDKQFVRDWATASRLGPLAAGAADPRRGRRGHARRATATPTSGSSASRSRPGSRAPARPADAAAARD